MSPSKACPTLCPSVSATLGKTISGFVKIYLRLTQASLIPLSNLKDVIAVGPIAHKYQMDPWRKWALLVLNQFCENTCSLSSNDRLAIYSFSSAVAAAVLNRWLPVLRSRAGVDIDLRVLLGEFRENHNPSRPRDFGTGKFPTEAHFPAQELCTDEYGEGAAGFSILSGEEMVRAGTALLRNIERE
ncbi:hypothetical protein C8R47DRAFT_1084963 [Mycena vitilis]|nr:hypothetical protein C8R47DRAFT_1084963 [Mycena vitilis]